MDLDEFACRSDVNVSFGVANSDGLSEYSPPTLVNVSNIRGQACVYDIKWEGRGGGMKNHYF